MHFFILDMNNGPYFGPDIIADVQLQCNVTHVLHCCPAQLMGPSDAAELCILGEPTMLMIVPSPAKNRNTMRICEEKSTLCESK